MTRHDMTWPIPSILLWSSLPISTLHCSALLYTPLPFPVSPHPFFYPVPYNRTCVHLSYSCSQADCGNVAGARNLFRRANSCSGKSAHTLQAWATLEKRAGRPNCHKICLLRYLNNFVFLNYLNITFQITFVSLPCYRFTSLFLFLFSFLFFSFLSFFFSTFFPFSFFLSLVLFVLLTFCLSVRLPLYFILFYKGISKKLIDS